MIKESLKMKFLKVKSTVAGLIVVFFSSLSLAQNQSNPEAYIEAAANEMLMTSSLDSTTARFDALDVVLQEYFDLSVISIAVIGQHRALLNEQQLARFNDEFRIALVNLLATALGEIDAYEIEVGAARMRDSDRAQVPVDVDAGSLGDFEFQFSLARNNERWNALNLIVNGVNVGITFRNQFNELMTSNEDNVDSVIDIWRETVAEIDSDF
jgi:phospholipid transport system substrate-binding protein